MAQGMEAQRFREYPVIWDAAVEKARQEGTTISAILRVHLREFLGPDCPKVPDRQDPQEGCQPGPGGPLA